MRGLQLGQIRFDPLQHLDQLGVLVASVVLDEAGGDRRRQQGEEAMPTNMSAMPMIRPCTVIR